MNLHDLRYFVALAEEHHFGRAAASCGVSQPTLSTQIHRLENEMELLLAMREVSRIVNDDVRFERIWKTSSTGPR